MKTITDSTNWLEIVKNNLPTEPGYLNAVVFKGISQNDINSVLHELSSDHEDLWYFNGCDQDWSAKVTIEGTCYSIWGSLTGSSLCMEIEE